MLKTILGAAALSLIASGTSYAATDTPTTIAKMHRVQANGRCDGVSYGTGARRCNSASGGPSGGLSSRN